MPVRIPTYYQINLRQRQTIERLYEQGYSPGKIARQVFRSRSTITREIRRNGYPDKNGQWQYNAKIAQRFCEHRQRRTGSIRGADTLHPREPSGNYIHNKPIIPPFRINHRRKYGIELKRWLRKYHLSRWHENYFGKEWRKSYNWLRNRCYSWEEFGRRLVKSDYSPSSYTRLLRTYNYRYRHYRSAEPNRPAGNSLSVYRKPLAAGKKQLHLSSGPCIFPKEEELKKQSVFSPIPSLRTSAQRPNGIAMSKKHLNLRFFKIPSSD